MKMSVGQGGIRGGWDKDEDECRAGWDKGGGTWMKMSVGQGGEKGWGKDEDEYRAGWG